MKSKSLRSSMLVIYITSILIPFFIISALYSYYYNIQILNNNKTNVSNTLQSISSGIGIYIRELNSISNVPYFTPDVFNTMEAINSGKYQDIASSTEFLKNSKKFRLVFLKHIYNATQTISGVTFIPENNQRNRVYIMSRNANETKVITDNTYKKEDWYSFLQENDKKSFFYPVYKLIDIEETGKSNELIEFSYTKTIRNVDTKKNIGIIKVDIPSDNITNLINNVDLSALSYIAITSSEGDIIYAKTDNDRLLQLDNIHNLSNTFSLNYQVITTPIENTTLQLVYLSSKSELLNYQLLTYFIVFLFTLIAVSLSYIIYRHNANKITLAISKIKDTFHKIETGDLTAQCTLNGQQEFIEISNALNHMTRKLNEHIIKEYKANLSQQEAEYRALQAQINPHFLYNTLNGFIALNRMGEKKLLENSIIHLTHLFQYTCSNSTITMIESELSFIEQYLELQKLKYDERLTFSIEMEPGTENVEIPKLIIQPLIENAILHGMEPSDTPIYIQIQTAFLSSVNFGEYLMIRIKDNGVGFNSSNLESLQHIGLKNIEKRLKYSNAMNVFQIRSREMKGTECIILYKY